MGKFDAASLAADHLAQGEEVIAAVRVNWNGMVPPSLVSGTSGLAGLGEASAPPSPDQLVIFPSARQLALVLTGGRLLAWSLGLSGKPKAFLGEVPLTAITQVTWDELRFGGLIRVLMASTAKVDLEVMRGEPGEDFFDRLAGLISDGSQG